MAKKSLPASTGYFNDKMLKILEQGETKTTKKSSTKTSKTKSGKK